MGYSITTKDGITIQNIPDDTPADSPELKQRVDAIRKGSAPKEASVGQKVQASFPGRVLQGIRDPIDAVAQMAPRALSAVTSLGGLVPNKVSGFFDDEAKRVDSMNSKNEADYQQARKAAMPMGSVLDPAQDPGFDGGRLLGNVVSPANAAIAARLPVAATALGRVGVGLAGGAAGGALTPVDVQPGQGYAETKAAQVGLGAVAGGVLGPVAGKLGDMVQRYVAGKPTANPTIEQVIAIAQKVAGDAGTKWEDMAPAMQQQLTGQVQTALKAGPGRDPAALVRQADFAAEKIQPTLGQLTRDGRQFANERNLRQLPGTGDPLLQTFENQGRQLTEKINDTAKGAANRYQAGSQMTDALGKADKALSGKIRESYKAARESTGKDDVLPLEGLAQDAADVLDRFGDKVPSGIVNQLKKYGILPDQAGSNNPRKLYTVESMDDLLKVINSSGSRTDDATNAALTALRASVKKTVSAGGTDDVFAPARKLAADRFALHDAVPALEAAAKGTTAADDFVNRFVINGKTDDVLGLSKVLKENSPEAYQQARAQIGEKLRDAAFGQNVAGDKSFSVERYAKALKDMGPDKLGAFFSPEDIARFERLGRIGAYINQFPNSAPVNNSGNWAAITSLAGKIPGISPVLSAVDAAKTAVGNTSAVKKAVAAEIPKEAPKISPADIRKLSQLLGIGTTAAGASSAQSIK